VTGAAQLVRLAAALLKLCGEYFQVSTAFLQILELGFCIGKFGPAESVYDFSATGTQTSAKLPVGLVMCEV
jgi:hypothetical protein